MLTKLATLIAFSLVIVSCQKNDADVLHEAQSCLNTSPASEARSCVEPLASMSTPEAYKLKCSAIYISEGFGAASSLISALDSLNGSGDAGCSGSCSSTLTVMNAFNFSQGDNSQVANRNRNLAVADEAVSTCGQTQSKAYVQVSSLFKLGTLGTMVAYANGIGGATPTVAELEAALPLMPPADVGFIVSTTYDATCVGNTDPSESTVKYCTELSDAIGGYGDDTTKIGNCLLGKLADPAYVCPP